MTTRLFPPTLRFACRRLFHQRGTSAMVIATVATGIAVSVTAFSVVNAAFLAPPDVARPDELVTLYTTRSDGTGHVALSYPDYRDVATATTDLVSGTFGYSGLLATWSHDGQADALFGELVTGTYFPTLGIQPALGRLIGPDDDRSPGQHPVIVIGHTFWRTRLGADPDVVGRPLTLNGLSYETVGVAPASFNGLLFRGFAVDVWAPSMMMGALRTDELTNRSERWLFARGRLRPDADIGAMNAALATVAARLEGAYPESNTSRDIVAFRSSDVWISPDADGPLLLVSTLLIGACVLVLVIGLSNTASVLAAGMAARTRELAIHAALGATRWRLLRGLLVEAFLLSAAGGALGLLCAFVATRWLSSYRPPLPIPVAFDIGIDFRVFFFAAGLSAFAAVMIAASAIRSTSRADRAGSLAAGTRPQRSGRARRHWLLVPQVAGSVVLLVVAALLARSVANASNVDPGFDATGVGMLTFTPGTSGLDDEAAGQFVLTLAERAAAMPEVRSVAVADRIPLDMYGSATTPVATLDSEPVPVQVARVSAGYFDTLAMSLLDGRDFTRADLATGQVVIVNETFAAGRWPEGAAVSRELVIAGERASVIGVVPDAKVQTLSEAPTPMVYVPFSAGHDGLVRVIVAADGSPATVLSRLARDAASINPSVAIVEQRTMTDHLASMMLPFELASALSAFLGALATLLAGIGLHGLVAMAAASRTREFGIRAALGARPLQLVRAAGRDTARATAVGLVAGLALAALVAQTLSAYIFGISALDPLSFAGVALLMSAVAAVSALAPLGRVTRTDPVVSLRAD